MRTLFGSVFILMALWLCTLGCSQSDTSGPAASAADVVLNIPAMH